MSSDFRILGYSQGGGGGATGPTGPTGADGPTGPTGPAGGGGGGVTGTGVATRAAFWIDTDEISSDAAFYWDNTGKQLWLGATKDSGGEELTVVGDATMSGHMSLGGDYIPAALGRAANSKKVLALSETMTDNGTRFIEIDGEFEPALATNDHTMIDAYVAITKDSVAFDVVVGDDVEVDNKNDSGGTSMTGRITTISHSVTGGDIETLTGHRINLDTSASASATIDTYYGIYMDFNCSATTEPTGAYGIYIDDMEDFLQETGYPFWYDNDTSGRFIAMTYNAKIGINFDPETADAYLYVYQSDANGGLGAMYIHQEDEEVYFTTYHGYGTTTSISQSIVDEGAQGSETREGFIKMQIKNDGTGVTTGSYYVPFYSLSA